MSLAVVALVFLVGWELARGSICRSGSLDSIPRHLDMGSGDRTFRRSAVYLRDDCLIAHRADHCGTAEHRDRGVSYRTGAALDSTAGDFTIEMLAAIPSVILGLWGIFVMIPFLRDYPFPFLQKYFAWTGLFTGPIYGVSMLAGGIIIAVMILPIITSVSREILRSVPDLQREAAYALGATRWEVTRIAVLSYARRGLFGAVILGLGRALGETMAVTMVIGNTPNRGFASPAGYTLASVIANEFTEATTDLYLATLFEIGLVLFGITILANLIGQLLLRTMRTLHCDARCLTNENRTA